MSVNVVLKSIFDDKGIKQAEKAFGGVTKSLGGVAAALGAAFSVRAITSFASDAITAASNLSAEFEGVNQIFGEGASAIQAYAKQASELAGLSETEALRAAKNFGGFATAAGLSGDAASKFSLDLVQAAGDLASFADVPVAEAIAAIGSGLAGQSEPLRKFQIFVDDTTLKAYAMEKGLGDAYATMTQNEKTILRQAAIMDQLGVKQGDFVKYQDTFGNALKTVQSEFQNLQAQIGTAMIPAMEALLAEVKTLIPEIGEKLLTAVRKVDWASLAESVGKFIGKIVDNLDKIIRFSQTIGAMVTPVVLFIGALKTAIAVQGLFNAVVKANPYVLAATALIALAGGMADVMAQAEKTNAEFDLSKKSAEEVTDEIIKLRNAYEDGLIPTDKFLKKQAELETRLRKLSGQVNEAAGELNRYNNLLDPILAKKKAEALATPDYIRAINDQTEAWKKLNGETEKQNDTGGGVAKKSPAELRAERFAAVQEVIKKAQKAIADAEEAYARQRFEINRDYEQSVARLRKSAQDQQENIVKQSLARITNAFKSATQIGLADLFNSKTTSAIETTVKKLTDRLTVSISKTVETTSMDSVDALIQGMRDKLAASKQLIQGASQLASEGFSQTFIEQVISAGTETGNAMADAILKASPETKSELKSLYSDLETISESGANSLADTLYNTYGLATQDLKEQSQKVADELKTALEEQNKALAQSLADAGYAFGLATKDIKDTFLSDLAQFDGWFAGLGKTIDELLAKMAKLSGTSLQQTQAALTAADSGTVLAGATVTADVAVKQIQNAQGLVVDSMNDVAGTAAYLQARIEAANKYISSASSNAVQDASAAAKVAEWTTALAGLQGAAASGSAAGTVININVKTDTTQSQAMVGKTIGNIVTKYVTTGGQVLVSGNQ